MANWQQPRRHTISPWEREEMQARAKTVADSLHKAREEGRFDEALGHVAELEHLIGSDSFTVDIANEIRRERDLETKRTPKRLIPLPEKAPC